MTKLFFGIASAALPAPIGKSARGWFSRFMRGIRGADLS
jgi:hypothetical protein